MTLQTINPKNIVIESVKTTVPVPALRTNIAINVDVLYLLLHHLQRIGPHVLEHEQRLLALLERIGIELHHQLLHLRLKLVNLRDERLEPREPPRNPRGLASITNVDADSILFVGVLPKKDVIERVTVTAKA